MPRKPLNFLLAWMMIGLMMMFAYGRDLDGKYTNSPLKPWFESLRSDQGLCCSFADGIKIEDVDWDVTDGHYRVFLDGAWRDVPDKSLIKEPNRFGPAVVWPLYYDGKFSSIRCFIPGAGT